MEARAGGVGFLSGLGADIAGVRTTFFDGPIAPNPKAKRKNANFSGQLEGLPPPPSTVELGSKDAKSNIHLRLNPSEIPTSKEYWRTIN